MLLNQLGRETNKANMALDMKYSNKYSVELIASIINLNFQIKNVITCPTYGLQDII